MFDRTRVDGAEKALAVIGVDRGSRIRIPIESDFPRRTVRIAACRQDIVVFVARLTSDGEFRIDTISQSRDVRRAYVVARTVVCLVARRVQAPVPYTEVASTEDADIRRIRPRTVITVDVRPAVPDVVDGVVADDIGVLAQVMVKLRCQLHRVALPSRRIDVDRIDRTGTRCIADQARSGIATEHEEIIDELDLAVGNEIVRKPVRIGGTEPLRHREAVVDIGFRLRALTLQRDPRTDLQYKPVFRAATRSIDIGGACADGVIEFPVACGASNGKPNQRSGRTACDGSEANSFARMHEHDAAISHRHGHSRSRIHNRNRSHIHSRTCQ